jgi:hypothetical protein
MLGPRLDNAFDRGRCSRHCNAFNSMLDLRHDQIFKLTFSSFRVFFFIAASFFDVKNDILFEVFSITSYEVHYKVVPDIIRASVSESLMHLFIKPVEEIVRFHR